MQGSSWLTAAKRTLHEFADDALSDRAAALTYYAVLSIFPGLLVVISLLGLLSQSATQPLITSLTQAAPSSVRQIITHAISNLQNGHGAAGLAAIVGFALALWSSLSPAGWRITWARCWASARPPSPSGTSRSGPCC
jgi:membrane protein